MSHRFLTARWSDVVLANFRVPPALLQPYVPPGSELDTPDGQPDLHLLSLVALRFSALHVYGVPVPTAQDFPEVNLRYYVRREARRAAVFLREFVPAPLVILGARLWYNQPYYRAAITHAVTTGGPYRDVHTTFRYRDQQGVIRLRARNQPMLAAPDSEAHFLKEHYWGFDRRRSGRAFRYRVAHPVWRTFPVERVELTINPGALLGGAWRLIDWQAALHSVLLAEGSSAQIYAPEPLGDERGPSVCPWRSGRRQV